MPVPVPVNIRQKKEKQNWPSKPIPKIAEFQKKHSGIYCTGGVCIVSAAAGGDETR